MVPVEETKTEETTEDKKEDPVIHEYETGKEADTPSTRVAVEIPKENMFHSNWTKITGAYDCLAETFGSTANAIRALKIAQGIEDVDLLNDIDALKELVELSNRRDWATMRQYHPGFNFDVFKHYYSENDLFIKLPDNFAGCTKNPDYDYRTGRASNIAPAAKTIDSNTNYRRVQGKNGEYYVIFYGPEQKTVKSATEAGINEAIETYKKENPGIELVEKK